jgi:hypothetical protein
VHCAYIKKNNNGNNSFIIDTACVRDGHTDKWHYFDDSKFSLCDENKVVVNVCVSLFFLNNANSNTHLYTC